MTATMDPAMTRGELLEEYRIALRLWSEARALYPAESPEIERAAEQLTALETQLTTPGNTTSEAAVPALEAQG